MKWLTLHWTGGTIRTRLFTSKAKCNKTLALPVIHYEFYKSVMQYIELFCAY